MLHSSTSQAALGGGSSSQMPSFSSLRATAWFRLRHLTGAGPPLGERAGRRIPARSSSGRFPWRRPRPGHGYALEDADDLLVAGVNGRET